MGIICTDTRYVLQHKTFRNCLSKDFELEFIDDFNDIKDKNIDVFLTEGSAKLTLSCIESNTEFSASDFKIVKLTKMLVIGE